MIGKAEARELVDAIFEEEALVIGGLVAVDDIEDDLVWRLVRSLDAIRRKALRSLEDREPATSRAACGDGINLAPHPAIEEFLLKIRSE